MTALMTSCASEEPSTGESRSVAFAAAITNSSKVDTRAGIEFSLVQGDYKDIPFYIKTEVLTSGSDPFYEKARYQVAPGMLGRLSLMDGEQEILWYNKKDPHTYYAWTMPWQDDDLFDTDPDASSVISFMPEDYKNLPSVAKGEQENCAVMERFIATKTQPLAYNINGELVEMYFQHLVSKITVNARRVTGDFANLQEESLEAEMTFIDMPQKGIFHRRPEDGSAPYVEKIDDTDAKGVSYWIGSRDHLNTLYVCPEIDFSDMRFAIHFNDGHGNRSDYYGDFKSVNFKRPDEDLGHWDDNKKNTVLYAGEEMTINFVLRTNDSPTFSVTINPWKDVEREGVTRAKKGIYTVTELQDLYNTFVGGYDQDDIDEVFDLFGVEEDGQKYIYMYEDMETNHGHFPLDPSFILDGLGHVLTTRNTTRKFPGESTNRPYCAQVPACRNIFLTNGDGEHMVYIDDDYHIWIVDPVTMTMRDSGNTLSPVPLEGNQKSFFIDYETGQFDTSSTV